MTEPVVPGRDRSFGGTLLLGLAGGALAAVAGTREWAQASGDAAGIKVRGVVDGSETAPLVATLALVALAAWGVVLVVRGRIRRVVAALGILACAGALASVVDAFDDAHADAVTAVVGRGATADPVSASLTGWYYAAGIGATASLLAFGVAIVRVPRWPAMGSKYDAPAACAETPATDEDMWRALDQGRDPTS